MSAPITYVPDFLGTKDGSFRKEVFNDLYQQLEWERRPDAPRYEYWTNTFGTSYSYGRGKGLRTYEAKQSHWIIEATRDCIAKHTGHFLEGCFLNRYEDGRDALGWHSDDDPLIDHSKPIAVITWGEGRDIQIKEKQVVETYVNNVTIASRPQVTTIFLEPGSLLLMHPGMQQTHFHRIPKVGRVIGPRISMTYRGLLNEKNI